MGKVCVRLMGLYSTEPRFYIPSPKTYKISRSCVLIWIIMSYCCFVKVVCKYCSHLIMYLRVEGSVIWFDNMGPLRVVMTQRVAPIVG